MSHVAILPATFMQALITRNTMKPCLNALFVLCALHLGAASAGTLTKDALGEEEARDPAGGASLDTRLAGRLHRQAGRLLEAYRQNGDIQLLHRSCALYEQALGRIETAHRGCEESGTGQCLMDWYYPVYESAVAAHYELFLSTGHEQAVARAWIYAERTKAAHAAGAPPPIEQVCHGLRADEGRLSYFLGDKDIYAMLIRHEDCRFIRIRKDFPLEQLIHDFRSAICAYPLQRRDSLIRVFRECGWDLYQKILAPLDNVLPYRISISADGALRHLPFEILLNDRPGNCALSQCPYLLRRHSISYAPPASLGIPLQAPRKPHIREQVLAFAPEFVRTGTTAGNRGRPAGLTPLPHNQAEVEHISRLFPVKAFTGRNATKERFQTLAPGYRVIHLATHARANVKEGGASYLCFSGDPGDTTGENRLLARELLPSTLHAELVVLSACESGRGELRRGEGMVGLSSAFLQAGARSVVGAQWRINDRQAAVLMDRFYAGLRQGLPKDEALRRAKLDYLAGQRSPYTHPFFWAAFVVEGDMSPLDLPKPVPAWAWAAGMGLVAAAWGYGHYRMRRRILRA